MRMRLYKYLCIIQLLFLFICLLESFSAYIYGVFPLANYLNISFDTYPSKYREENRTIFENLFEPYLYQKNYKPFNRRVKIEDNLDTIKIHTMLEFAVNRDSVLTLLQLTNSTEIWVLFSKLNVCSENDVAQNNQFVCKVNSVDDKFIQGFNYYFRHCVGDLLIYDKIWYYASLGNRHLASVYVFMFLIMIPISLFIHIFLIVMFLSYIKEITYLPCFYLLAPFIPEFSYFMIKMCFR